ncbi:MAG TPA: YhgE/Pip domain-containing protein [Candidatus Corynebacterium avicola]|uniref:YhgE/Pip domain-containing protein n=1 Tax=Candidatus Corynebacterium avicola TaxID=2838527 RepID=A0A9D1RNF4_9CORY|nr:YhgE/Pip domain-containing protein [Candidatus Corynebacterium avicola]
MKKTLSIVRDDLRALRGSVMTSIVVFFIMVVPMIFSVFNVLANWNPFENTDELEIAVANADSGYESDIAPMDLNLGDQVLSQLSRNDQIDWVVTDEDDAVEGAKSGDYYAAIVLPENFSSSILTFYATGTEPTTLDLYTNEKKNALSTIITEQGAEGVITQINETFTEIVANVGLGAITSLSDYLEDEDTQAALERMESRVENIGARLESGASTVRSLTNLLESTSPLVDGAGNIARAAGAQFDDPEEEAGEGAEASLDLESTLDSATSSLEGALGATSSSFGAVSERLDSLFSSANSTSASTAATFDTLAGRVEDQVNYFKGLRDNLDNNIGDNLPDAAKPGYDRVMSSLDAAIDRTSDLHERLAGAASDIREGNSSAQETKESIEGSLGRARDAIDGAVTSYREDLKPQFSELGDTLDRLGSSVDTVKDDLDGITSGMSGSDGSLGDTLDRATAATVSIADKLDEHADTFAEVADALGSAGQDGDFAKLAELVGNDPESLAQHLAAPINVEREAVFPVATFGSGMAPMYATLALWVGALLTAVLVRTNVPGSTPLVEKDDATVTRTQAYFGRVGLFQVIGFVQSTLTALGLIVFVEIEPVHPFLLMISCWVASMVFMTIVYTLVLSFGSVGKAISVIILVLQVSGAGGAYPLPLLPEWFQWLHPILPATYSVDAMRSAIAGMYQGDLWISLGKLLIFLIPALLLGLVLRRFLDGYNRKTMQALDSTKVMW